MVKKTIICALFALSAIVHQHDSIAAEYIVVTEMLKDPVGRETDLGGGKSHEFIEIANLGTTDLSLDSLFLTDGRDIDSVIAWHAPLEKHPSCRYGVSYIRPGEIALVLDPDYAIALDSGAGNPFAIAESTILLSVNDRDLGDGLAAHDGVFFYKGTRSSITRIIAFAADSPQEFSLTQTAVIQKTPGTPPEGTSIIPRSLLFEWPIYGYCPTKTSPGSFEMIRDGWCIEWRVGETVGADSAVQCTIAVLRVGGEIGPEAGIAVVKKGSISGQLDMVELPVSDGSRKLLTTIVPLDTAVYQVRVTGQGAVVTNDIDVSTSWIPSTAIRISEIFPRAGGGVPEWFEVYNSAAIPINLAYWQYGNTERRVTLDAAGLILQPGAYLVFTADYTAFISAYPGMTAVHEPDSWHTLNNYYDSLCLWDNRGTLRECVYYHYKWFTNWEQGSLERVSYSCDGTLPAAWVTAPIPSPGQPNRNTTWRSTGSPSLDIGPIPFTPNNDGDDDYLSIRIGLPAAVSARVSVYGFDGTMLWETAQVTQQQILWDGRCAAGRLAPAGPFFVVAEFTSTEKHPSIRKKGVLWR